jgi:hypothetical protein
LTLADRAQVPVSVRLGVRRTVMFSGVPAGEEPGGDRLLASARSTHAMLQFLATAP